MDAGWKVDSVDLAAERVTFAFGTVTTRLGSGRAPILDGIAALVAVVELAGWPSLEAAVAAHCVFLHPESVARCDGQAIVPVARDMIRRGQFGELLCCTPAFLANATDTHAGERELLRYRAWDLYGQRPAGAPDPTEPAAYGGLAWAPMPEPVADLEDVLRRRMKQPRDGGRCWPPASSDGPSRRDQTRPCDRQTTGRTACAAASSAGCVTVRRLGQCGRHRVRLSSDATA